MWLQMLWTCSQLVLNSVNTFIVICECCQWRAPLNLIYFTQSHNSSLAPLWLSCPLSNLPKLSHFAKSHLCPCVLSSILPIHSISFHPLYSHTPVLSPSFCPISLCLLNPLQLMPSHVSTLSCHFTQSPCALTPSHTSCSLSTILHNLLSQLHLSCPIMPFCPFCQTSLHPLCHSHRLSPILPDLHMPFHPFCPNLIPPFMPLAPYLTHFTQSSCTLCIFCAICIPSLAQFPSTLYTISHPFCLVSLVPFIPFYPFSLHPSCPLSPILPNV